MNYRRDLIASVLGKSHLYKLYHDLGKQDSALFNRAGEYTIPEDDMLFNTTLKLEYIDEHLVSVINPIPFKQESHLWGFLHIRLT